MPSDNNTNSSSKPYTVVLTGGIASGKSTVSEVFERFGIPIIDTDEISRAVVAPGRPALFEILNDFGSEILKPNGALDRRKLRNIVFSNQVAKNRLKPACFYWR